MKKFFITIALALATVTVCNAQYFVGGSIGLSTHSSKTEIDGDGYGTIKSPSTLGFSISPKVGYYLSPKVAVGLSASFGYRDSTIYSNTTTPNTTVKAYSWSVSPFARYTFLQFGKLSVLAEATVGINGTSSKTKVTSSVDGVSTFGYGVNVAPILSYDISKNFSLETKLNFLALGYNYTKTKTPAEISSTGTEQNVKESDFGFGVNSNNLVTVGDITIGAIYKF